MLESILKSIFSAGTFQQMLRSATPVALAALGGSLTEHAGIMNIGMDGMILMGAFFGVLGSWLFASAAAGVALAVGVGLLVGLFFALFVVKLRSDEFIIGCALNTFALGLTGFLSRSIFGASGTKGNPFLPSLRLPGIESIPFLGKILSGNSLFVYLTLLFVLLLWRGIAIAAKAPDRFGALLVVGFVVQVVLQAILNIAVVTNVTPNHLDHHKDMQEYIDAKRNILIHQVPPCREVLGYENEITRGMQADCKGKQVWFTRLHETDNGAFLRDDGMLCMAEDGVVTPFLAQKDVKLRGLHNIENLLAAAAAVWGEVPIEVIQKVGSTFTGVEHRIEPVRVLDGVTYYNDSIGTSPTRTIAGLRSFNQKLILIAGGYDKHIPYEPLAPEVIRHVKTLILMGATGPRIEKVVREHPDFAASGLVIEHADNMQHAVELARAAAHPGDEIILSPASASFDLYPNFEVRGREFKKIVNELK